MKVGLRYLDGAIPSDDIELFKGLMAESDMELKVYDTSGVFQASLEDVMGVIAIFLGTNVVTSIAGFIGPNMAWDSIKFMTDKIWRSVRGKKYTKVTSRRVEEKEVTFSVKANLKTDDYYFKIDGMKSSEELNEAMDKVLIYLDQQKARVDQHKIYVGSYDCENEEWIVKDYLKDVMEKNNQGE